MKAVFSKMDVGLKAGGRLPLPSRFSTYFHHLFQSVRSGSGRILREIQPDVAASSWALFIREWLRSPRRIGALCPSGSALAQAMAAEVHDGSGLVIELGAGTGAVTEALLRGGVSNERLIAVEQSASLARFLRERFPGLRIIEGDAADLARLLPDAPVDCVVSSIPLVSLPKAERAAVIGEIKKVLHGHRLIQFTYFRGGRFLEKSGLSRIHSRLILRNLPPAQVMTFTAPL